MASASVFAAGNTALITGAASGIGLAVAQLYRKHKIKLTLVDWNDEHLKRAKDKFTSADIKTYRVNISQLDQRRDLNEKV